MWFIKFNVFSFRKICDYCSFPSFLLSFLPSFFSPVPHFHRLELEKQHIISTPTSQPHSLLTSGRTVCWLGIFFSGDILIYWHFWHLWKLVPRSSQELLLQVSLNEIEKCLYFQIIIEPNVKLISTHFNNIWRKMHWTKLKLKILKI